MNVGDKVCITKCDGCPKVVGKTGSVSEVKDGFVGVRFGRGRPPAGRPNFFPTVDVAPVTEGETSNDS